MKHIQELLKLDPFTFSKEESAYVKNWIENVARRELESYDFCLLLGWFYLGDKSIPLSPSEVGLE